MVSEQVTGSRKMTDRDVLPARIRVEPAVDVVLQGNGEAVHEGRAGRDGVAVKDIRLVLHWNLDALLGKLLTQLLLLFLLLPAGHCSNFTPCCCQKQ